MERGVLTPVVGVQSRDTLGISSLPSILAPETQFLSPHLEPISHTPSLWLWIPNSYLGITILPASRESSHTPDPTA